MQVFTWKDKHRFVCSLYAACHRNERSMVQLSHYTCDSVNHLLFSRPDGKLLFPSRYIFECYPGLIDVDDIFLWCSAVPLLCQPQSGNMLPYFFRPVLLPSERNLCSANNSLLIGSFGLKFHSTIPLSGEFRFRPPSVTLLLFHPALWQQWVSMVSSWRHITWLLFIRAPLHVQSAMFLCRTLLQKCEYPCCIMAGCHVHWQSTDCIRGVRVFWVSRISRSVSQSLNFHQDFQKSKF